MLTTNNENVTELDVWEEGPTERDILREALLWRCEAVGALFMDDLVADMAYEEADEVFGAAESLVEDGQVRRVALGVYARAGERLGTAQLARVVATMGM